jgi:hypothetical protein
MVFWRDFNGKEVRLGLEISTVGQKARTRLKTGGTRIRPLK